MRIVVTGALGFIGRHVLERLASNGHEVVGLVRETAPSADLQPANPRIELKGGSLYDEAFVREQLKDADGLLHLAGSRPGRSEGELVSANAKLTGLLARLAAESGHLKRFTYLSCLPAANPELPYSGPRRRAPFVPRQRRESRLSSYARSKKLGEERVLSLAERLPVTVLRAPLVCGPGDRHSLALFRQMRRRVVPLPASGRDEVSIIFVDDLCDALAATMTRDHPSGSVFDVSSGSPLTWRQFSAAVGRALGVQSRAVGVPYWMYALAHRTRRRRVDQPVVLLQTPREWRLRSWTCDGTAIGATLDWHPRTSPTECIVRTTRWYRDAGWL